MTLERTAELLEKYGKFPILELCEMLEADNAPLYTDRIADLERERDAAKAELKRVGRELEAERAGAAAMREAFVRAIAKIRNLAKYGFATDLFQVADELEKSPSSTAGAEMLERLRKLGEREDLLIAMEQNQLGQIERAKERITTLEAALISANNNNLRLMSEVAALEAALATQREQCEAGAKKMGAALAEAIEHEEQLEAALEEARKALERVTDAAKSYRSDILGLSSDRDCRDPRNWQLWGHLNHAPKWPARDESITIADAAHERIGRLMPEGKP